MPEIILKSQNQTLPSGIKKPSNRAKSRMPKTENSCSASICIFRLLRWEIGEGNDMLLDESVNILRKSKIDVYHNPFLCSVGKIATGMLNLFCKIITVNSFLPQKVPPPPEYLVVY